jgi:hypothetical protein
MGRDEIFSEYGFQVSGVRLQDSSRFSMLTPET